MTLRRRFLLASSLARLVQRQQGTLRHIEGFFPERPGHAALVRLEESKGLLILRTDGPNGEVEDQTEVPVGHAHALLDVCAGEIAYDRVRLPLGDRVALIDQIIHPRSIHLVTVAFESLEDAKGFRPLAWFGPEVTGDGRYTHKAIALGSLNESPDIPLSNVALNGLLDTLEGRSPAQAQTHLRRPAAGNAGTAKAGRSQPQANGQPNKANLGEIEEALMREMALSLRSKSPQ